MVTSDTHYITAACPCMAPALVGVVEGTISAATYAATEKIAYGRNPSLKDTLQVGITSGVMAGGIQFVGQQLGWIQCFIAGTLVATKNGLVPIENIEPGDLVWATDEKTGETALKEVVQLFRNETEEWVHVTLNGEELTCTPNHPFYSPVKGWTSAVDLRAGDILVMLNGEYVVVEQVHHELLESPEITYNFEVEDYHTYYVGEESILVHNKCGNKNTKTPWDIEKYSKGTQKVNFGGKSMTAHYDGKYYWLDDLAGHGTNGTSRYKVFTKSGKYLNWFADADMYGNFITGKHKGPVGLKIRL